MKLKIAITYVLGTSITIGNVQASQCDVYQSKMDLVKTEYSRKFASLQKEAESIEFNEPSKLEAATNIIVDVNWEKEDFSFDIPEIKWKMKEFKFDIVQTRMTRQDSSFDVPEIVMVKHHLFDVFKCKRLKCRKKPVYGNKPEIRTKRVEVKYDLPKLTWETTSIKTKIPEIHSRRVHFKTKIPHFKVKDVKQEIKTAEQEGKNVNLKMESLANEQLLAIDKAKKPLIACVKNEILLAKKETNTQLDVSIAQLEKAIIQVQNAGLNPSDVQGNNLLNQLDELKAKKELTNKDFIDALESFDNENQLLVATRL